MTLASFKSPWKYQKTKGYENYEVDIQLFFYSLLRYTTMGFYTSLKVPANWFVHLPNIKIIISLKKSCDRMFFTCNLNYWFLRTSQFVYAWSCIYAVLSMNIEVTVFLIWFSIVKSWLSFLEACIIKPS